MPKLISEYKTDHVDAFGLTAKSVMTQQSMKEMLNNDSVFEGRQYSNASNPDTSVFMRNSISMLPRTFKNDD